MLICLSAVVAGLDASSVGAGGGWGIWYTFCEMGGHLAAALFRVVRPDDFGGSEEYGHGSTNYKNKETTTNNPQ